MIAHVVRALTRGFITPVKTFVATPNTRERSWYVVDATGQIIEGHVPANAVNKLIADPSVKGVSAPGMPLNAPGMGELDGNLVTVDFAGKPFSKD